MKLYPAIDLRDGKCVRLRQGRFDQQTTYDSDPLDLAEEYARSGAEYLHVVDLSGAKAGSTAQADAILRLVNRSGLSVQVGGGIRAPEQAVRYVQGGVQRVVLGSVAVSDPERTQEIVAAVGPARITLAVDVRLRDDGTPMVATHGWQDDSELSAWSLIERYAEMGLDTVLCTDIGRDGMLSGPNLDLYARMQARYPNLQIQASGGVHALDDLRALRKSKIAAVIVGKALLDGRFTVGEALSC